MGPSFRRTLGVFSHEGIYKTDAQQVILQPDRATNRRYTVNVKAKAHLLRSLSAGAAVIALAAVGFPSSEVAAQQAQSASGIDQIVVTGSRISRQNLTSTNPVSVLDEETYRLSGSVNVENLLNTLPQVVPGESGFTNNETSGTAQTDLRGLGPQRSLVLVNGRRYIFFDSRMITDLNNIPAALVERTELVTGGSSAVYGSDAIGGVVNFILRDDFEGLELSSQYDITAHGDANTFSLDLTAGGNFANGRGNAVGYVSYYDRNSVKEDARGRTVQFLQDGVVDGKPALVPGGSATIPNGRYSGLPIGDALAARPGVSAALDALGLSGLGGAGFKLDDTGTVATPFNSATDQYNFNPDNFLLLPQERWMVGTMLNYDITDRIQGYAEAVFSNNRVATKRAPVTITGSYLVNTDNPFLSPGLQNLLSELDASEGSLVTDVNGELVLDVNGLPIVDPAATANDGFTALSIGRRGTGLGTRDINFERNAWRVVAGLRGDLGSVNDTFLRDFSYDMYYSYARTRNEQFTTGNINAEAFARGLQVQLDANGDPACIDPSDNCVPINIFGDNITQEAADFVLRDQVRLETAQMQVAQATMTGTLFDLPAGPVGSAWGAEWRSVSSFDVPPVGSLGDVGVKSEGHYSVWELFGEVNVPVLANVPLAESLELNAAFRYSDYSLNNVGGSWTYGGGANWRVTSDVGLRAQYQRAVRAPSLDELFSSQSTIAPAASDPCALSSAASDPVIRQLCIANGVPSFLVGDGSVQPNFQITGIVGGNPDLKQETADTYTAGVVLTPEFVPGLSVTLDYYNIKVKDAIAVLGGSVDNVLSLCFNEVQNINSEFCQAIVRNPDGVIGNPGGGVSVLTQNIGKLKTDGVDLGVSYNFDVNWGLLSDVSMISLSSTGSWLNNFDLTPIAELPGLVNSCAGAFGLTCGEPMPEFKATTRLSMETGPLNLSLRWRWISSVTDDRVKDGGIAPATLPKPKVGDQNLFDLTGSYAITPTLQFTAGVINLFDNHQPLIGSSQEQSNTFPSTYDPLGARFFFNIRARF